MMLDIKRGIFYVTKYLGYFLKNNKSNNNIMRRTGRFGSVLRAE